MILFPHDTILRRFSSTLVKGEWKDTFVDSTILADVQPVFSHTTDGVTTDLGRADGGQVVVYTDEELRIGEQGANGSTESARGDHIFYCGVWYELTSQGDRSVVGVWPYRSYVGCMRRAPEVPA